MEKRIFLFLVFLVALVFLVFFRNDIDSENIANSPDPSLPVEVTENAERISLFIPYWNVENASIDRESYDRLIYFGITASAEGINKSEPGYESLSAFFDLAGDEKETHLVLRMLDSEVNFAILKDSKKQEKIIQQSLDVANGFGFEGIVLDLELSALPFDSLIKQINSFNSKFFKASKSQGFSYSLTMYGDVYYRIRPFDVKNLAENSDQIMIMAYDFSKANGNPGPNFPLYGKEKYGYDYTQLTEKLITEAPIEKIDVIFGLYGYDWQVDDKDIAQAAGKPLSYLEIKNSILNNCGLLSCVIKRDNLSRESLISYTATNGKKHTVWYEDMESISEKKKYLKTKGVYRFSLWAHDYF